MLHRGYRTKVRRLAPRHAIDAARALSDDVLFVDWVNRGPVRENWGDMVAPWLAERLSGRRVVNQRDVLNLRRRPVYTTIGSMLGSVDAHEVEVWGSGFVSSGLSLGSPIREVHAVRGPRTRARLLELGVECPDVFGDPAWLYPHFHRPPRSDDHRLGVIPHFKELVLPDARRLSADEGVSVIDIRAGLEEVATMVARCERIASASLHGLVLAQAYGIPAIWIRFSDRPAGDGFKFRDHLDAVGHHDVDPLLVDATTTADDILARFTFDPPKVDVERFLSACPFLDEASYRAHLDPGTPAADSGGVVAR